MHCEDSKTKISNGHLGSLLIFHSYTFTLQILWLSIFSAHGIHSYYPLLAVFTYIDTGNQFAIGYGLAEVASPKAIRLSKGVAI